MIRSEEETGSFETRYHPITFPGDVGSGMSCQFLLCLIKPIVPSLAPPSVFVFVFAESASLLRVPPVFTAQLLDEIYMDFYGNLQSGFQPISPPAPGLLCVIGMHGCAGIDLRLVYVYGQLYMAPGLSQWENCIGIPIEWNQASTCKRPKAFSCVAGIREGETPDRRSGSN